ncbi:MAG: hypothetical protein R3B37_13365 [Nitrospira sp.]|nr:hypothetical protein [Nitrospira sp.]
MTPSPLDHRSQRMVGRLVVGVLPDMDSAKQSLRTLRSHGIAEERIGLAMRHADAAPDDRQPDPSPTAEEAANGAVGGGLIGGFVGLLAATGLVVIPGLGPVLAGGALASVLGATGASVVAGAGVGAVTGGLVGGLVSINVPETAARAYDEAVRQGHILITVKAEEDAASIRDLLEQHGAKVEVGS